MRNEAIGGAGAAGLAGSDGGAGGAAQGGGIYTTDKTTLTAVSFTSNMAVGGVGGAGGQGGDGGAGGQSNGGGVFASGGDFEVTVRGGSFTRNEAVGGAGGTGGIGGDGGDGGGAFGGGLYDQAFPGSNSAVVLNVSNAAFTRNEADAGAGGAGGVGGDGGDGGIARGAPYASRPTAFSSSVAHLSSATWRKAVWAAIAAPAGWEATADWRREAGSPWRVARPR